MWSKIIVSLLFGMFLFSFTAQGSSQTDLLVGATDVEPAQITWAPNDLYCEQTLLLTDVFQEIAFGIEERLRTNIAISAEQEMAIGDQLYNTLRYNSDSPFYGIIDTNQPLLSYLVQVAAPLVEYQNRGGIRYSFHIIDNDTINAFAMPGGHIFIHTGLLLNRDFIQNEAELVGILAHEMGHVYLRHTTAALDYLSQLSEIGLEGERTAELVLEATNLMRIPYSNALEDAADRYAVELLFALQYSPLRYEAQWRRWDGLLTQENYHQPDPQQQTTFFGTIVTQAIREFDNLANSHSNHRQRACNARQWIEEFLPEYSHPNFYVGSQNLARFTPRTVQMY